MKSELIYLDEIQIVEFIKHCLYGKGSMVVYGKNGDKAILNGGKYMVRKDGRYMLQKNYRKDTVQMIMKGLIEKYHRFEYDSHLYHSPEYGNWTKEEI